MSVKSWSAQGRTFVPYRLILRQGKAVRLERPYFRNSHDGDGTKVRPGTELYEVLVELSASAGARTTGIHRGSAISDAAALKLLDTA